MSIYVMIKVGSLVRFTWWSNYKAPSVSTSDEGKASWHELKPGDAGVVLYFYNEETAVVLFSTIDTLLKVNQSMLISI